MQRASKVMPGIRVNRTEVPKPMPVVCLFFREYGLTSLALFCFVLCCFARDVRAESPAAMSSQITVYLSVPARPLNNITVEISAMSVVSDDGVVRNLLPEQVEINAFKNAGNQILLVDRAFQSGKYKTFRVSVAKARMHRQDHEADMNLLAEVTDLPIDVDLGGNQNASLFITWSPDASVVEGFQFKPVFTVKGKAPEISSLLVYITNEESGNVSVVNRQLNEVVATVMVGKRPRGVIAGLRRDQRRVYVANSGSDSISVIDPTTNVVEHEIPIRYGREPVGIAVARTTIGKEYVFVGNHGSNNVSVIDTATYQEITRADVGMAPVALTADPPVETIYGSRLISIDDMNALKTYREKYLNVYVANYNSKSISILKLNIQNNTIEEVITIEVQWNPAALFLDYQRGRLYVANYGYDSVSVIDILQVIRGSRSGMVSAITNIGTSSIGIISDSQFDRLYLLKQRQGEIILLRPPSDSARFQQASLPTIVGSIPVGKEPRALVMDPERRKIFVVNRGDTNVAVIDSTTRKEEKLIPVGRMPYAIAMFPD